MAVNSLFRNFFRCLEDALPYVRQLARWTEIQHDCTQGWHTNTDASSRIDVACPFYRSNFNTEDLTCGGIHYWCCDLDDVVPLTVPWRSDLGEAYSGNICRKYAMIYPVACPSSSS